MQRVTSADQARVGQVLMLMPNHVTSSNWHYAKVLVLARLGDRLRVRLVGFGTGRVHTYDIPQIGREVEINPASHIAVALPSFGAWYQKHGGSK